LTDVAGDVDGDGALADRHGVGFIMGLIDGGEIGDAAVDQGGEIGRIKAGHINGAEADGNVNGGGVGGIGGGGGNHRLRRVGIVEDGEVR
jgi:hypothetical protein